jgi:hypothetical protein
MATVEPHGGKASNFGKGSRDQESLVSAFPQTPMYVDYEVDTVNSLMGAVLQGEGDGPDAQGGIINDGGHFFGTVDLNYVDSPNLADVVTGGGGLPSTPYTPNPASPDDTGVQPEYAGTMRSRPQYGSGLGGTVSPSATAIEISAQTVGSLISGKSYTSSDGSV